MAKLAPLPNDLSRLSVAELRTELANGLSLTVAAMTRLAAVWGELARRGEDLSDLRGSIPLAVGLIAAGRLAAEAVVAFAGRPAVLNALDGLPLDRQRELAAGARLPVADPVNPGRTVDLPVAAIPSAALRVVFADGAVRTPAEQRLAARRKSARKPAVADDSGRRYTPRLDRDAGVVWVGKMAVPLADLLDALATGASRDVPIPADDPRQYATEVVRLHFDEQAKLRAAAKKADLPAWEIVRKALRAAGVI